MELHRLLADVQLLRDRAVAVPEREPGQHLHGTQCVGAWVRAAAAALPVVRGGTTDRIVTIADPNAAHHGVPFSAGGTPPERVRAGLATHARLAVEGRLTVPVVETFALTDAAKAQELSEAGHVRGKLVSEA